MRAECYCPEDLADEGSHPQAETMSIITSTRGIMKLETSSAEAADDLESVLKPDRCPGMYAVK